ncbi:hypothetical protein ACFQ51_32325 [Streptomyces kaempferi]
MSDCWLGAWLGITGADSYAATTDVVLRAPTSDPFAPTLSSDKAINMGSERQTALSRKVAEGAAKRLGIGADGVDRLQHGLQVTNPPQTLVLHFTYTAADPKQAARRANALTQSYIDLRKEQWEAVRGSMLKSLQDQLNPVAKQNDELARQIKALPNGSAADSAYAVQANLLNRITDLRGKITSLKALDMTPGNVIRNATVPPRPTGRACRSHSDWAASSASAWACSAPGCVWSSIPRRARRATWPVRCAVPSSARCRAARRGPWWSATPTPGRPRSTARSPSGWPTTRGSPTGAACSSSPRAAPWSRASPSRSTSPPLSRRPARTCCWWRPICAPRPSPNGSTCRPPSGPIGAAPASTPRESGPAAAN